MLEKKIVAVITFLVVLCSTMGSFASSVSKEQDQTIKVGYVPNYGIIDGHYVPNAPSFAFDYFTALAAYTGHHYEYVPVLEDDWERLLEQGEIDLFGPVGKKEKWTEKFLYTKTKLGEQQYNLVALEDAELYYDNLNAIHGLRVGIEENSPCLKQFLEFCNNHNIFPQIITTETDVFRKDLEAGLYDVRATGDLTCVEGVKQVASFGDSEFYFIGAQGRTHLIEDIDSAMPQLLEDEAFFIEKLYLKYYSKHKKAAPLISEEEKQFLQNLGPVKVGYHTAHQPYSYMDEDGNPSGVSIDMMGEVIKRTGLQVHYVPLAGKDAMAEDTDFSLSIVGSQAHDKANSFTPFYMLDLFAIERVGRKEEKPLTVVCLNYNKLDFDVIADIYQDATIIKVDSTKDAFDLFFFNKADVLIHSSAALESMLDKAVKDEEKLRFLHIAIPLSMTSSNDIPTKARKIIDKAIASITMEESKEILYENIVESKEDLSIIHILYCYRYALLAIVVGLFVFYCCSMRVVRRIKKIELEKQRDTDRLTGVLSRQKFFKEAQKCLAEARENQYSISVVDIDNFKAINESRGYEVGNQVIMGFVEGLKEITSKEALICRDYNDIVLILQDRDFYRSSYESIKNDGRVLSEKIKTMTDGKVSASFSHGLYIIADPSAKLDFMVDCANHARLQGKSTFGTTSIVYTEEMYQRMQKKNKILSEMEDAIKNEEFFIVIQPKKELQTGRLIGGEVLVRWQKADGKNVYPDDFIPIFEENNFIAQLDRYVLEKTCQFIKDTAVEIPRLSVNVSVVTALRSNHAQDYLDILDRYNVAPSQIELEITETVLDSSIENVVNVTKELRKMGFYLSIDDFGKGASSLTRIKNLDFHVLKLDREFIRNNTINGKDKFILQSIISMSKGLGLAVLAEGIENEMQLKTLVELGCDFGQGYFFDKPLAPSEFLERVVENSKKIFPQRVDHARNVDDFNNFEHLSYGVVVIQNDSCSTIIKANTAFYKIIGYSKDIFEKDHDNCFRKLEIEDLDALISEKIKRQEYRFNLDFKIRTGHGEIVWVSANAEYNPTLDVYFASIMPIANNPLLTNKNISFEDYYIQKEIATYISTHTSDYVYVVDVETNEFVYINEKCADLLGLSNKDEWKGHSYHELMHGKQAPVGLAGCADFDKEDFAHWEYFNAHLKMSFAATSKLIPMHEKMLRVYILSDITAKKAMERKLSLQLALNDCIEVLYDYYGNIENVFERVLSIVREYYGANRAFYLELDAQGRIKNTYEVVADGVPEQGDAFHTLPCLTEEGFFSQLKRDGEVSFYRGEDWTARTSQALQNFLAQGNTESLLMSAVQNTLDNIIGLIVVDNPAKGKKSTELIRLLSRFVLMFLKNMDIRQLEKEASLVEERAKVAVLSKCANTLQNLENADETIVDILTLLRRHYGADCGIVLLFSEDRQSFTASHESCDPDIPSRLAYSQNKPFAMIEKWVNSFEKDELKFTVSTFDDLDLSSQERKLWQDQGVSSAFVAPIYGKDNILIGLLSLDNPEQKRSLALLQVVAKFISDYHIRRIMRDKYKYDIALDRLAGLYNKISTEDKIKYHLERSKTGTLFMIDIDNFKGLNDSLGHMVGDRALVDVSQGLKEIFRQNDIVGRSGGDEFMVFVPIRLEQDKIEEKALEILKVFKRTYQRNDQVFSISATVGICSVGEHCSSFECLYEHADSELYKVKESGKNNYSIFTA